MLSGKQTNQREDYSQILSKYGEIVTREQLGQLREELEVLEAEEQKKLLQYQIKSKTFATTQIINFLEKRSNDKVENASYQYLAGQDKENLRCNNTNLSQMERAYVDQKIQLAALKNEVSEQSKKDKRTASRKLWLILSRMLRVEGQKQVPKVFNTLLLPKQRIVRC